MARVFSDMSAAGPLPVQWAFLYLLQLLLQYVWRRPHRRGCMHARFPWEDSFGGSAADHSQLPCNCHQRFLIRALEGEEDNNANGQISRELCRFHPTTFNDVEEHGADQNMASWNFLTAMLHRLLAYMGQQRTATPSSADPCTWVCRRETGGDGIQQTTPEGSGDNFDGIACSLPDVEESTASRKRATTNGHRSLPERLTDDDVELRTSTCLDDRYRSLPGDGQYSTSYRSLLRFCLNIARHEVDRDYSQRISIDHGFLSDWILRIICIADIDLWDWNRRSLWCTFGDVDFNINEVFSEHRGRRRRWQQEHSSEDIPVQHDDSLDWKEQSCIDSTDAVSDFHDDGSCLGQNSVSPDADIDTHCSETLHGTVTNSADSGTVASSSTQLGGSSDGASSPTTEQSGSSDNMDDCESMNSSITTEELLVRQRPDSNEEMEVCMPQQQARETGNGSEGTRSTSWWHVPGFRFLPTDKEIVLHYLKRKVLNRRLPVHQAVDEGHNVYALDADEITLDGNNGDKERLGFFFVQKQEEAYCNGCYYRTADGYWRIRGRPALVRHRGRTVAFKTAMDFHRGRPPHGRRTPWSMFEYALNGCHVDLLNLQQPRMNAYVVCKVRRRESKTSAREERRRHPGLLRPRRPFLKKISPRRFRPGMIIGPEADVGPKRKEEDPSLVGEEPIVHGKHRRPVSIF